MRKSIATAAIVSVAILVIAFFARPSRTAGEFYFYWAQTDVNTSFLRTCYTSAEDVMRTQGFQNIRRSPGEVTGWNGGTYAAVTCVGTSPRATAIVAAVGNNNDDASRTRDVVRDKIHGIIHP